MKCATARAARLMEKQKGVSSSLMEDREGPAGRRRSRWKRNSGVVGVTISYGNPEQQLHSVPARDSRARPRNVLRDRRDGSKSLPLMSNLATYTCQNHLVYMADGWSIKTTYNVGKGSSGRFVDCMKQLDLLDRQWGLGEHTATEPSSPGAELLRPSTDQLCPGKLQ